MAGLSQVEKLIKQAKVEIIGTCGLLVRNKL